MQLETNDLKQSILPPDQVAEGFPEVLLPWKHEVHIVTDDAFDKADGDHLRELFANRSVLVTPPYNQYSIDDPRAVDVDLHNYIRGLKDFDKDHMPLVFDIRRDRLATSK